MIVCVSAMSVHSEEMRTRMDKHVSVVAIVGLAALSGLVILCAAAEEHASVPERVQEPAPFEKRVFTLPDGKHMNCRQRKGDGPVLVLIPGTWGTFDGFAALIAELPGDLPLVVIELCWQGGNVPPTLDLSIEQLADDVLWVVEALGLEHFYIGGHSIGGMIAVEIAGREIPGLAGVIAMEGWTHHTVAKTAFANEVTGELTPSQRSEYEAYRVRGRAHLSDAQMAAIAAIWRRWNGHDCLMRSKVPILEVWGDRGKPRPPRETLQIPERPNIQLAWVTGASHLMLIQAPKAVAEFVCAFIERNASGSPPE